MYLYYTSLKCGSSVGSSDAQKLDVTVMTAPTTKADGIMSNLIIPLDRLPTACDAFTSSILRIQYINVITLYELHLGNVHKNKRRIAYL